MYMSMCRCGLWVQVPAEARSYRILKLELQVVVCWPTWILGTRLGSSGKTVHAYNYWAVSPALTKTGFYFQFLSTMLDYYVCGVFLCTCMCACVSPVVQAGHSACVENQLSLLGSRVGVSLQDSEVSTFIHGATASSTFVAFQENDWIVIICLSLL